MHLTVMTCNVRYYGANDGENGWLYRRQLCVDVIRSRSPHIICTQELSREQCRDLKKAFPDFACYGLIDEAVGYNPTNGILFRRDSCELLSAGGYWLSESPHVPGSSSWESACVRLANWTRLRVTGTDRELRVVNTHLDHVSQLARVNQARLIVQDAAAFPCTYPQVLTGDMNCDATNEAIHVLKAGGWLDSYAQVHGTEDPGHTFHRFVGPAFESTVGKMDWVFYRGELSVVGAEVIRDSREGRFPSDHYFCSAEVEI